jgi:hypothetical protein
VTCRTDRAAVLLVADTIRSCRFRYASEDQLQQGLEEALLAHGFAVEREVRLDGRNRIDLMVDRAIGVEVKVAGTAEQLRRQAARYVRFDEVEGLVIVTSRVRHLAASLRLNGKPIEVVCLAGAGL